MAGPFAGTESSNSRCGGGFNSTSTSAADVARHFPERRSHGTPCQRHESRIGEAEANARKAESDGQAYANLTIAKAQAEALRVQNAALSQNKDVLELRRIEVERIKAEKWDGALPTAIYAGAPIPFLNVGK